MKIFPFVLSIILLIHINPIKSQDDLPDNLIIGDWFSGECQALDIDGSIAYIGCGSVMRILNIFDLTHPIEISSIKTPEDIIGIKKSGDMIYIINKSEGLHIIDISDINNPEMIKSLEVGYLLKDIQIQGEYVYLCDNNDGLIIIDVSDSFNPTVVDSFEVDGPGMRICIKGDLAYISDGGYNGPGLTIVDISNPEEPEEIGAYSLDADNNASGIFVCDSVAYLAVSGLGLHAERGVHIIDVSHPEYPVQLGIITQNNFVPKIHVEGDFAYISYAWEGLSIVDISNKNNPQEVGFYDSGDDYYIKDFFVREDYLYIADGEFGFKVIDITAKDSPVEIGMFYTRGSTNNICASNNYIYTGCNHYCSYCDYEKSTIRITDIKNPEMPVQVCNFMLNGFMRDMCLSDEMLFITHYNSNIQIVDVNDPENPGIISSFTVSGRYNRIQVSNSYAYVLNHDSAFYAVDINVPDNPEIIDSLNIKGYKFYVSNNYVYIANYPELIIVDVSQPDSLEIIGTYDIIRDYPNDIFVYNNHAFLAYGDNLMPPYTYGSWQILNLSPPDNPTEISYTDMGYDAVYHIIADDNYAYLSGQRIWVFDISDINNPKEHHEFKLSTNSIFLDDNYFYSSNYKGFYILNKTILTNINNNYNKVLCTFTLFQNYPNPFNPVTVISWQLAASRQVNLSIYNILGQKVATLLSEKQNAGKHSIEWDASGYSSGVYFYRLQAGDFVQTKRMLLIK